MKSKTLSAVSIILTSLLLIACNATTIGLQNDFKKGNFSIGKSDRNDVVNYLGLPQKIVNDDKGNIHYLYEGETHLVGLCIGCGNVNGGVGLIPSLINQHNIENGAEYVFDPAGLLIAKFESEKHSN